MIPARALTIVAIACVTLQLTAPASTRGEGYVHNRFDYEAFRAREGTLLEPNYLPFMATPVEAPAGFGLRWARRLGLAAPAPELLVFCRWPASAFPLRVEIRPPVLPAELLDELAPPSPDHYVRAVRRALELWEVALEGKVGFTVVDPGTPATLRIDLIGASAPDHEPGVQVLGSTRLRGACRVDPGGAGDARLTVRFQVPELQIFVADRHGLLLPDQVERVALHEIGHALGMYGHSPIPADLMYRIAQDRLPRGEIGTEDVNSFVSFYTVPNGTIYAQVPQHAKPPASAGPLGPPRLALAPHVDARLGFEVQLPEGWTRVVMEQGVIAVDGVTWDYDASLQVLMRAHPSIDAYLSRYAAGHFRGAEVREQVALRVSGHRALRFSLMRESTGFSEELTVIEAGGDRVVVVIAECLAGRRDAYGPWFDAVLASLELWGHAESDRDYEPRRGGLPSPGGSR